MRTRFAGMVVAIAAPIVVAITAPIVVAIAAPTSHAATSDDANSNAASTSAEKPRDERLLEILLERGILTEAEFEELRALDLDDRSPGTGKAGDSGAFDFEAAVDEIVALGLQDDAAPMAGYDRGFFIDGGEAFSLRIGGRVQVRYAYTDFDDDTGRDDTSEFSTGRVRLDLRGHAFDPSVRYRIQIDPAENPDDVDGDGVLRDAYIQWNSPATGAAVRAGQFKTPFGRQWIIDADRFQLVDRADPARFFLFGRDVGLMLHGNLLDRHVEYAAAVFNGNGAGARNDGTEHLWVARVVYHPLGLFPLQEGDPDRSEALGLSFGANYAYRDLSEAQGMDVFGALTEAEESSIGVDAQLRYLGFSLLGEAFARTTEEDGDLGFEDVDDTGFYVQGGYFLLDRLEVAARWSSRTREDDNASIDDDTNEITVGLGYYLAGHGHKVQLDFTRRTFEPDAGDDVEDDIVRLQWLLAF